MIDRWDEVEGLFEEALALEPEARAAFLEALAARDPALHTDVAALLDAHEEAPGFFDGLSRTFVAPLFSHLDEQTWTPDRIGAYRVIREVGRGGMSTVYLADRADGQFEQQVALKLVRQGAADSDLLHRFLDERQILASLNHPHVARLFDGGVTGDGRPYFVMEYVDGEPIDRYCDARRLSLEQRLRLFQVVLEAVQYAHGNLVVHRDLKPSNVLVSAPVAGQPVAGQVKLLDFGIAKLLGDDEKPAAKTQTQTRWMTPEYAAPEQIRGDRVTTATDVYQLGVMLYKLLTGHRPYRVAAASTYEIERAVCEDEPTRPSMVVSQVEEVQHGDTTVRITPEWVSQTRDTEWVALRQKLAGDLDAIVLKALRKEPEQRYATAEAFSEDIRRYLAGRPVAARRGTFGYRARKYVRRNRWGLAAAAVIAALLVGYAVTATIQAGQIARQRDRAQLEAVKAEEVAEHLIDLFTVSDANEARSDLLTAREILDQGVQRVQKELRGQPEVQAEALTVIGRVYASLGLYDASLRLLESADTLRRQALQGPHPDRARGLLFWGETLADAGAYEEAEARLREAVAMGRTLPAYRAQEARSMVALGNLLVEKKAYAAADSLYRAALALQQAEWEGEHKDIAETLSRQALLMQNQEAYAAADSLYRQALAMQRRLLGENHPAIVTTLINLAGLQGDRGHFEAADSLYRQALDRQQYLLGDAHPDVAKTLNNLGRLHQNTGRLEQAEGLLRRALRIKQDALGEDHPSLAFAYFNLATVLQEKRDYVAAESLYTKALAIDRKVYGDAHTEVATDLTNLAALYHLRGELDRADRVFAEALAMRRLFPAERLPLSTTLLRYGRLWIDRGRAAEAEALLREALALRVEVLAEAHWGSAEVQGALGACLARQGRFEEAEVLLRQSRQTLEDALGRTHRRTRRALADLAALYEAWDRPQQAQAYRRLLAAAEASSPP